MEKEVFKICYVKSPNSNSQYAYLCNDIEVQVGDFVYVEGCDYSLEVTQVNMVSKESSPLSLDKMKNVIKNLTNHDEEVKTESIENNDVKEINKVEYVNGINIVSKVEEEFSYIDYHTDSLIKIKDECHTTYLSLIKEISIVNNSDGNYDNAVLRTSFSSNAFKMKEIIIDEINPYEELVVRIPFLSVDKLYIESLQEIETTFVKFELIDNQGNIICSNEYNFKVLPLSQPSKLINNDLRLYSKFVTPQSSRVKQVTLDALNHNEGNPIITYQNYGENKYNKMLKEAQAIYLALHDYGIAYQNPPAGGIYTQRVRMPEEVLRDKKGTCLDLSILFAACLEEVGFHSILVLIDGHAFSGFFLEDNYGFPNGIEYNCGKFSNVSIGDMRKIVLVECTAFTVSNSISFQEAINLGIRNIKNYEREVFSAIDINYLHKGVFSAVPIIGENEDLELKIKPKEIEDKELDSIVEVKYIDVLRKEEKDRFTFWERKLLDLNEKNRLVNFSMKIDKCLKLTANDKLQDLLAQNDAIKFICLQSGKNGELSVSIENEFLKGNIKPKDIYQELENSDKLLAIGYEKTLKNLIKSSNDAMEETGAATLYLCLGVLTYNRKRGNQKGHAPFMVLPIRIIKEKMSNEYNILYDYEEVMINQTFFEYYKQEHPGVNFEELYSVTHEDKYEDIVNTFKTNNTEDIQLDENSFFIANLTFAHHIMWLDMRKRKSELKKNKVVQSILENRNVLEDNIYKEEKSINDLEKYHDFAAPLYYDSTQLKAILECGKGKSFILDGPPGTGKSQTIVNMIVNAFYNGKTVLFVAEKKAALDVVAERLKKLGDPNSDNNLGRFCLELHSNKASKTEFFEKLKHSMELGVTKDPSQFEEKCEDLENRKKALLNIINKMHEKKYYYSLYDAIVRTNELADYKYSITLDEKYLLSLNDKKKKESYELMDLYISEANHIKDFNNNPLRFIGTSKVNLYDKNKVIDDFNNVLIRLNKFENQYKLFVDSFGLKNVFSNKYISLMMQIFDLIYNKELYSNTLDVFVSNYENKDNYIKIFDTIHNLQKLKKDNSYAFNFENIKNVDYKTALLELERHQNPISKIFTSIKWKKTLKSVVKIKFKLNETIKYYKTIKKYNDLMNEIINHSEELYKLIGFNILDYIDDTTLIEENINNTYKFIEYIKKVSNEDYIDVLTRFTEIYCSKNAISKMKYSNCDSLLKDYKEYENNLFSKYKIDYKNLLTYEENYCLYKSMLERAVIEDNFIEILDIASLNTKKEKINELNLSKFIDAIIQNKIDYKDFKEVYDLSCVNGYIWMYFKDEDINFFNPTAFDAKIKEYKKLINEYNGLVIECVSAKLTKNLNHNNIDYAKSSPIGILKKTISNNGRGVSIRDTLLNYDDIIKKYFPCFLMSPLSAAQYLAVDEKNGKTVSKFDIVIFDEASQLPTHEAVGPIARGKSLIVAGDPEQMPPSAYFKAGLKLEDDELVYEDATSLLDECIAIELPRIRLSYHYRSKHESLINFSNHNFYNDKLYTFPSPNTKSSFVEFKHIELKEEKKKSDITDEEVNAICDEFKSIYLNEKTKNKSVGIIVFNMEQQDKVFKAITNLISSDNNLNKIIEEAVEKTNEPWFVKSLENVQGDERDIIILAISYGKSSSGRANVLGPIVNDNGQRRLNVAVSRSKEKMIVLSTIRYTDFEEDSKITRKGRLLLKQFLKYAEESAYNSISNDNADNHSIAHFIRKDLENRGYQVVCNVGNSDFRVDLAVVNQEGDNYQLGILIDSKELGKDISLRDKLYVQESVLNALKWKIINVYSIEYFKDRKGTIEKIIESLDKPYVKEENTFKVNIEKEEVQAFKYNSYLYKKARPFRMTRYENDHGFDDKIKIILKEIIETESPVSFETIKTRVRTFSNIQSMSSKARSCLMYELNPYRVNTTYDQGEYFYWKDSNRIITQFRTNSERDISDIAKEEIVCAMKQVLEVQGDINKEDLFRCTLNAFEYGQSVLNKKNIERLDYVYNWAKKENIL